MKRLLVAASLAAVTTTAFATAAPVSTPKHAPPAARKAVAKTMKFTGAPADEYFGRLKLSILGIRNTIKDLGLKCDNDPAHGPGIMGSVALTEDAIHDWEHKYPKDSWIPKTIFALERLYAKVDDDGARDHAKKTMAWLVHDFPRNNWAVVGQRELAQNLVGVKPSPASADTQPVQSNAAFATAAPVTNQNPAVPTLGNPNGISNATASGNAAPTPQPGFVPNTLPTAAPASSPHP